MTCETKEGPDGLWFICWGKSGPPKDKKVKCSVCRKRWSTLLCDGSVGGVATQTVVDGVTYQQQEAKTCDAPLCEVCTTRAAPGVIALPDHRADPVLNGVQVMKTEVHLARRRSQRGPASRMRDDVPLRPPRPIHVEVPAETVDFCPTCAARLGQGRQGELFGGGI